ncbi:PREDICTED: putative F-box/kelch-repeat protein At1g12870 [Camelina sativa]|uniref:F-box/kelch-repeat protein At1g12870 n=1 Tax=Camelina sativa TaxID=90675 RepID=A0ABM1RPB1_CAMSA|nr:PREDICTED: putative F-box/kelch-repeat protein At1g12870 [Camelina sativa]
MDAKKRRGVNILDDIVEEILVKVPVRSLVKFKAVSKQWKGTIESKWFADKQVRSQKSLGGGQARIVKIVPRCFGRKTRRTRLTLENLLLMPPNGLVYTSPYRLIRHPRPRLRLRLRRYKISEPCDGLFCIYTKDRELILVNPATNSSRILPDPNPDPYPSTLPEDVWRRQITLVGIGRENVANNPRCKVFALDSNTWRYVDPPNRQRRFKAIRLHRMSGLDTYMN